MSDGHFVYEGELEGHRGWVTSIAAPQDNNDNFLSASRDGTVLSWKRGAPAESDDFAHPLKRFEGHSGFVQDVALSSDGEHALTGSWDQTLRLWSTKDGQCNAVFRGHTNDVLSVAFAADNRQIVSGGRDCKIKMWNSRGYDNLVKLWTVSPVFRLATNFEGHTGYLNSVAVSPDGSLCASGGKDGLTMLWDLGSGSHLYQLDAGEVVHALTFSPNRYWLCAATESCIRIWDLESKKPIAELAPRRPAMGRRALKPESISLAWSMDGNTLYTGYTDNKIHVFGVRDC